MGVKHKTVKDEFPRMKKNMEVLNGEGVEVGVIKGEHTWLAAIHEYGCDIQITPRMRKFLHFKGLHVKEGTTHIKIPERSFLRSGYDENRDVVMKHARLLMADVVDGSISPDACMEAVGIELSSKIKDYAVDLKSPANHEYTLEHKNTSNPLVKTGDMVGGITWRKAK